MKATMDKAGRVVVPAAIRERLGMVPGPVELVVEGTGVRIEVEAHDNVIDKGDRLIITGGPTLTADDIRELRLADQR